MAFLGVERVSRQAVISVISQEEVVEELAKHWEELGMKKESESAMEENRMESIVKLSQTYVRW